MSPRAPSDRKLSRLIRTRVAEDGLRDIDRVLFLGSEGEVLETITSPLGPVDPDKARSAANALIATGNLTAIVHLFAAYNHSVQFGVVEVFDESGSTIHGILSGGEPHWVPIADQISDKWGWTWNTEGGDAKESSKKSQ